MLSNIVITGANRGIGLALASLYKSRGNKAFALCRQSSETLDALGVEVLSGVDVSSDETLSKLPTLLSEIEIDLLINNAGVLQNEILGNLDVTSIRRQFEVNALGPLKITEALLAQIKEGGKIALITSRMGSIADNTSGGRYGYRMSKAALNIAGVSLAHDVAARKIAVAILHPGLVGTRMIGGAGDITPNQAAERLAKRIEELTLDTSGRFWHSNGELLPW